MIQKLPEQYHAAHISNISINVLMFLNNYQYILSNYTMTSQNQIFYIIWLSTWVLFILLIQSMNVAKLLSTPLFCISNCFVATLAVVGPLVIVMIPSTSICAHPFKLVGDFFSHFRHFKVQKSVWTLFHTKYFSKLCCI